MRSNKIVVKIDLRYKYSQNDIFITQVDIFNLYKSNII